MLNDLSAFGVSLNRISVIDNLVQRTIISPWKIYKTGESTMTDKIEELEKTASELQKQIKELKELKESKGFPEPEEYYFTLDSDGHIIRYINYRQEITDMFKSIGNCFRTRELAEREVERRKLMVELKVFSDFETSRCDLSRNTIRYSIIYDVSLTAFKTHIWSGHLYSGNEIYFKTRERAKEAIDYFGDRLNLLLLGPKHG